MFGEGGEGFMRVNVATDLETLKQAFHQLKAALND
jgi:bifunctional pyridoxal-dependent enzyme with beta-cystathionase and maltose regulon repressor activities